MISKLAPMMTLIIAKLTTVVLEFEKLTHSNVY